MFLIGMNWLTEVHWEANDKVHVSSFKLQNVMSSLQNRNKTNIPE